MKRYAHLRISSDPAADAEYYFGQLDEIDEKSRPKCCVCGQRIYEEEYFRDDDGYKCEKCVHDQYYESRDDYLDRLEEDY